MRTYENILDLLDINKIDLDLLKTYTLEFSSLRDPYTEKFRFDKPFISSFCKLLVEKNNFPTQKDFRTFYFETNKDYLKDSFLINNKKYLISALIARLNRCYPSLVRDLHFSLLLAKETDLNIFYNDVFDFKEGIDILINDKFALRLFVNTKTSYLNRYKKDDRRTYSTEYTYIDLPITMSDDKLFGSFYLYNKEDIKYIKQIINT